MIEAATRTAALVVPLAGLRRTDADLARAGGKAAGLGELIGGGFPVPPGFCVTTAAYDLAAERASLAAVAAGADSGRLGAEARAALLAAPMPDDVAAAVTGAYAALGGGAVAVRSSATAEDLPTASFAGQQETELNVVGVEALLEAVRRCWASLWTDRAVDYREAGGIDHAGVRLAVVVQRMVDAEAAGVLFTVNPVTGARREVVIDASEGLGEAVVSGRVTPDRYVVAKQPLRIKERRLGRRETVIRARAGGGTEETASGGGAQAAAVPPQVVRSLARMGIAIERHAGAAQDVEWAWAGGRLYALQSRPITALPQHPPAGRLQRLRAGLMAELMPLRPYPLDLDYLALMLGRLLPAMFDSLGADVAPVEEAAVSDSVVVAFPHAGPKPGLRMLKLPWVLLWRVRDVDLAGWRDDPLLLEALRRLRALDARDPAALDWAALVRTTDEAIDAALPLARMRSRYLPRALRDTAVLSGLLALAGQRRRLGILLSGGENKTLAQNRALDRLAAQVRAIPALREAFADAADPAALRSTLAGLQEASGFLDGFHALLEEYGHRETVITLASEPTWRQAPEIPLGAIMALASGEPAPAAEGPAEWERARDELLEHSVLGRPLLRGRFLEALERARRFPPLREDTHFYFTMMLPVIRASWMELGRRLSGAGVLETPEDVFHLRLRELADAGTPWPPPDQVSEALRRAVARRKARRAALGERFPAPAPAPPDRRAPAGALLSGIPASGGVAAGPVRVVGGPAQFGTLKAGEILVAPFTNPAWTPLFRRAVAVVVETGGAMSHAAIVAREYGIPAVMGAAGATATLADGQRIRVDGTNGVVHKA